MATVKANTTLVITPKNGASYDLTFGGITQYGRTSGDTIGVFPEDKDYTLVKYGTVEVYSVDQYGMKSYAAEELPSSLPAGTRVVVDGSSLAESIGGGKFATTPLRTAMTRLFVTGDSISCVTPYGTGLLAGEPYAALLKAKYEALGITFVNPAQPDQCFNGYWRSSLVDTALMPTDTFVGMHGFNTIRNIGVSASNLMDIGMAYEAYLAWCAVPESAKVRVKTIGTTTDNPAVISSANWNNFPAFVSGTGAAYTQTAGSTKTFTVTGDTVYVWFMRKGGVTGLLDINIDGVSHGGVSTDMSYVPYSAFDWEPAVMRIPGLSTGTHTVVITGTVTGQAQPLIAVAGFNAKTVSGPRVVTGLPIKMSAAGYATTVKNDPAQVSSTFSATWEPQWMYGDGGVKRLHDTMSSVIPSLQNDGLNIKLIDVSRVIDVRADITADVIHPNKKGHLKIFNLFDREIANQMY